MGVQTTAHTGATPRDIFTRSGSTPGESLFFSKDFARGFYKRISRKDFAKGFRDRILPKDFARGFYHGILQQCFAEGFYKGFCK